MSARSCPTCSAKLVQRYGESASRFAERRYCNRSCHLGDPARQQAVLASKECAHCSTSFQRSTNESARQWEARAYCGRKCSTAARWGPRPERVRPVVRRATKPDQPEKHTPWRQIGDVCRPPGFPDRPSLRAGAAS